jgi:hypothetical protein
MCLEPVNAAHKVGPKIERHHWLLQSIDEYEHMDFSWERRCGNIDWDVYAAELHERVSAGFQVQRLFGLHQLCSTICNRSDYRSPQRRKQLQIFWPPLPQHHNPIDRFNFILTSSAHTNHPLTKSNDIMVPMANHLPSTLYVCSMLHVRAFLSVSFDAVFV